MKGGLTYENAYYDMPIYLRNFYVKTLADRMSEETAAIKQVTQGKGRERRPGRAPPER